MSETEAPLASRLRTSSPMVDVGPGSNRASSCPQSSKQHAMYASRLPCFRSIVTFDVEKSFSISRIVEYFYHTKPVDCRPLSNRIQPDCGSGPVFLASRYYNLRAAR